MRKTCISLFFLLTLLSPLSAAIVKGTGVLETLTHIPSTSTSLETLTVDSGKSTIDLLEHAPKPMKITCLTIGTRGDVQPYIALCQRLNTLGHTCTIATHKNFEESIRSCGIGFAEVKGDPRELIKHCIKYGKSSIIKIQQYQYEVAYVHRGTGASSIRFWYYGLTQFGRWFDELLESSWEACKGSELLIESPSAMVGIHIAQSLKIPYFRAFTMPWTPNGAYAHAMMGTTHDLGRWVNKLSYKVFDESLWLAAGRRINQWRVETLNLERTTLAQLELEKVPFLYNFSPSVVPKAKEWDDLTHVTGYWFVSPTVEKNQESLEQAIKNAKSQNKKIIVPDPSAMTEAIIGAVDKAKSFAIVSGGWTSQHAQDGAQAAHAAQSLREKFGQHPDLIYYVDSVAHDWLFPKIDGALHHGGAGTTAASLRAGIPTIIKPFFGAQRVQRLGVGTYIKTLQEEDILEGILETYKAETIAKAKALAIKIRNENGVDTAIRAIYDHLHSLEKVKEHTIMSKQMEKHEAAGVWFRLSTLTRLYLQNALAYANLKRVIEDW
ncbi:hypothetical protein O181_057111 [Austropuccinia psidii MF-1]|uniref:Glycosyltransferase family 28 N-terminal domain-containing protein n=1 Tax=Austropuccinia psidii MF-1 TaxID=1389203 RepID=A0A9Q3E7N6_9BASI|nr:hypothetical protein [Austropuccinia psidii MF-1]